MVLPAPGPLPLLRPAPVTMPPSHERPPPTATAVLCVRLAAPHTQPTTSATRCSVPTVSAPTAMAEQRPAARRAHTLRALADERKRRRAAAAQARRVRSRQLIGAAEAAAAQDGPLTDEQRRVLDGRDRERARRRAKRRRTATENDDCGDREELAVAAAVIAHLAD